MSEVRILPEVLSNKIAAGEVVERPASIVKELVENALDAAGNRIIIDIEQGGKSLIRVADNGCGMSRDDALLSIERYATSKIYTDQDLFAIRTLGFRGEALPSIASVSRFSLVTRETEAATGTELQIEGGRLQNVREVGAPAGTMVTVRRLFFNTPARRKFLKTTPTELGHIADTVASMGLAWPAVHFRLTHNGRPLKDWPGVADPLHRVLDVFGKELQHDLQPVGRQEAALTLEGWVSFRTNRSSSQAIYLFVNGRHVRDRVVQHALLEAYAGRLMKGRFPVAVLFLKVPFDQVDVNVHPTKNEVRFANPTRVHDALRDAVQKALKAADRPAWVPPADVGSPPPRRPDTTHAPAAYSRPATPVQRVAEERPAAPAQHAPFTQPRLWEAGRFADLKIIGQFRETYLLCESDDALVLIDQHAAHERIFFEQLKRQATASEPAMQKLLIAETLDLGYREAEILRALLPQLLRLGLEIEPFGGNTFAVKAVPAMLAEGEVGPLVVEIVEKVAALGWAGDLQQALDACLIVMACHGSVRANQALGGPEIHALLQQLDGCENPSNCPHGRPTWIRWSVRFLEKSFRRIP